MANNHLGRCLEDTVCKAHDRSTWTVDGEAELKQFLKLVKPEWSCPKRKGHNNIHRVVEKLKDIGVTDPHELGDKVHSNTINDLLTAHGHQRFTRDTLESIRKQSAKARLLEHLKEPYIRQTGAFAPVPQLLSGINLRSKLMDTKQNHATTAKQSAISRPATTDIAHHRGSLDKSSSASRPNSVGAVGLGDHGGVFVVGRTGVTASETFSGLLCGKPSDATGTLYLRHARPRHGRSKATQRRPVVTCSLPDLNKIHTEPSLSSSALDDRLHGGSSRHPVDVTMPPERTRSNSPSGGSRSPSTYRGRCDSSSSCAGQRTRLDSHHTDCDSEVATDGMTTFAKEWVRMGDHISKEDWAAKWLDTSGDAFLNHGEAMLREQAALDDKKDFFKMMDSGNEEPFRHHVAMKIRERLQTEKRSAKQIKANVDSGLSNISKQLRYMQVSRKELEQKRKATEAIIGLEVRSAQTTGDSVQESYADLFRKNKARNTVVGEEPLPF